MNLSDRLRDAFQYTSKNLLLALIPILMDIITYFVYITVTGLDYSLQGQAFVLKFGIISAPPSVGFLLDNFPSILPKFNTNFGEIGLLNEITLFNIFVSICYILFISYMTSCYMNYLEKINRVKLNIIDFFKEGNANWFSYFILGLLNFVVLILCKIDSVFSLLLLPLILLYYVQYSIVIDNGYSVLDNFITGVRVLLSNLGATIKMAICFGPLISLCGIIVFPVLSTGKLGMIIAISLVDFIGVIVNKAVLESYREFSSNAS